MKEVFLMAKRCLGCMKLKEQSPVCEHCGFNENIPNYPHQLPLGTLLRGQYRVGKVLGQGGFGITYMGWDENLDVPVAIKEYYPNGFVNRECTHSLSVTCGDTNRQLFYHNRERFIREAKALAKLRDVPGIVRIHNFFQENETAYIVMEYVEGIDLKRYIRSRGRTLSAAEVLHVLKPVMEAMIKVHEAGLVHRDITPDNIMVLPDGTAKLLDFGAVREVLDADADKQLSQATEAILKQGFAPMEQYQNKGSLGPWTDVYALCATMYYCVTGKVPPDAPARLLDNRTVDWHLVPGFTQQQKAALEKGMAILPRERTASVAQLWAQLYGNAQPAAQNYVNSNIQGSAMPNDFRNAYQAGAYSNAMPNKAPDPISNTGHNGAASYPNHTVPLEANPISGYQAANPVSGYQAANPASGYQAANPISGYQPPVTPIQPVKPISPVSQVQPVTKKKSKTGLIVGIAAAVLVAVVGIGAMGSKEETSAPATPQMPSVQAPAETVDAVLTQPASIDALLSQGPSATYTYRNGWRLELYRDSDDNERILLYYNGDGQLEYKSIAEYHSTDNISGHWVYDGSNKLIRQETYERDKDGNIQSYVQMSGDGSVLETGSYIYDRKGNLTSRSIKAGDGTTLRVSNSTFDDQGNELTRHWYYQDGSRTEFTYNENGDTKTQISYDRKGKQENRWEYTYDAQGRRSGSDWYNASNNLETTSKNEFDANDNVIRTTYYKANGTVSYTYEYTFIGNDYQVMNTYISSYGETEYTPIRDIDGSYLLQFEHHTGEYSNYDTTRHYDLRGNTTDSTSYNFDGSLNSTSEYSYDAYGTMLSYISTNYSEDGSYRTYEYDGDYNTIGSQSYDASGNLQTWNEYEYDSNGNQSKVICYNADGTVSYDTVYTYDETGKMTQYVYTSYQEGGGRYVTISDGDYNTLESMSYDANGNRTRYRYYKYDFNSFGEPDVQYCYDETGKLVSWTTYEYDANGNYVDSEYHYNN